MHSSPWWRLALCMVSGGPTLMRAIVGQDSVYHVAVIRSYLSSLLKSFRLIVDY